MSLIRLYAHNAAQRSVRAAARELRVALRHTEGAARDAIEGVLETLATIDETLAGNLAADSDQTEVFPEMGAAHPEATETAAAALREDLRS